MKRVISLFDGRWNNFISHFATLAPKKIHLTHFMSDNRQFNENNALNVTSKSSLSD